tara:strand:+ start:38884 stop:39576 length:693 start_codon:yes stop_codon:yes gene_type:complete
MFTLTVIIPFFNEQEFLEKSLKRVIETNVAQNILLVDDNSSDNSSIIANKYVKMYEHLEYIKIHENKGKGFAISNVKDIITTTHVAIHDADLEYNPNDLKKMFKLVSKYPNSLILGSRFIGDLKRENIYLRTYFANKLISYFFSFIQFYRVTDVATCYKLFPNEFFKNLKIREKGFSIEIELLAKYLKYNKSIVEVPINYVGRSYAEGKKIKLRDGFFYILNTIKYRFRN